MELKDLKTGMRIVLRNEQELIVLKDVVAPNDKKRTFMYQLMEAGCQTIIIIMI